MAFVRKRLFEFGNIFDDLDILVVPHGDLATDIYEEGDNIIVKMQVPGIAEDNIEISVDEDRLKVTGSREEEKKVGEKDFFRREIKAGAFERMLTLPAKVDKEKVTAVIKHGTLKITLPKKKTSEPKKVKVATE